MRIGIFLPNATFDLPGSPEVGGIETFSFTVGEAFQRMGHEVILFGGAPKYGRKFRASKLTLELHPYWETKSIPDIGTRFQRLVQRLHFAWSIRKAWNQRRCDLVLLAKPFDWPVAWWWKRSRPELKTVMGFQGTDFFACDSKFYHAVDGAFAVSEPVADLAEARVGRRPALIPNPVDVDFFSPVSAASQNCSDWHLVSSGRFVGWKGHANLIEALARLRDDHGVRAKLTIAGDGPERGAIETQIEKLGLKEQVKLAGLLDATALRDLLRTGDLYVLPSIGLDACPLSGIEAASTGLPLLLSSQVGLACHLTEQDQLVYPARDVATFTTSLKQLHDRRGDAAWTDRATRHARLREKFSPENVARQILDLVS